jgi:hypothetical protein
MALMQAAMHHYRGGIHCHCLPTRSEDRLARDRRTNLLSLTRGIGKPQEVGTGRMG